jgi:DNA-binding transcriptional MerR regulator
MKHRTYTIGEASRLSGVSVRRLRFYSDKGLLPPAGRTESGYRVFTDEELVRLDLIRCLRDAGLGLDAIREVLSREFPLADALRIRLRALEAEIASQRRVASALRAVLRSPELTEADLRRYWTMINLSRTERRNVIERFYSQVSQDVRIDPEWMRQMIEASTPELPDDPTPEQCDAWIELSAILDDPGFVANVRSNAKEIWDGADFDLNAWQAAAEPFMEKAKAAVAQGFGPGSETAHELAQEWLETSARVMGRAPDDDYKAWLRTRYAAHDSRSVRYWELVAIMKGQPPQTSPNQEWNWIIDAMKHHLAE